MPELARFYGIVIRMYYVDHNPPHFHAMYGEYEAVFQLDPLELLRGQLPPRARNLVIEWATHNRSAIEDAWQSVQAQEPPKAIPSLE